MAKTDPITAFTPSGFFDKWMAVFFVSLTIMFTLAIYLPLLRIPFNGEDQAYFFLEMSKVSSWKNLIHLVFDYSQNRLFHKGDTFLFRPLMIGWLALQYKVFSYHYTAWNSANLALHFLNLFLFFRVLKQRGSLLPAALTILFFASRDPLRYEVGNNHMGGYLLGTVLFLTALHEFYFLMNEPVFSRKRAVLYLICLGVAAFFYEMFSILSVLMGLTLLWQRRKKLGQSLWEGGIFFLPALIHSSVFMLRAWTLERPMLVGEEQSLASILSWEHFCMSWTLARGGFNTYCQLLFPWGIRRRQILLLVLLSFFIFRRGFSKAYLKEQIPFLVMAGSSFWIHNFFLAFFRGRCFGHYYYLGYLILTLFAYSFLDWKKLSGRSFAAPAFVVLAFAAVSVAQGVGVSREAAVEYKERDQYFSMLNRFVDEQKKEKAFSFKIENPTDALDEVIGIRPGYFDSEEKERGLVLSEYLYAPYYNREDPPYRLTYEKTGRFSVLSMRRAG